jgi:hypothetical protein
MQASRCKTSMKRSGCMHACWRQVWGKLCDLQVPTGTLAVASKHRRCAVQGVAGHRGTLQRLLKAAAPRGLPAAVPDAVLDALRAGTAEMCLCSLCGGNTLKDISSGCIMTPLQPGASCGRWLVATVHGSCAKRHLSIICTSLPSGTSASARCTCVATCSAPQCNTTLLTPHESHFICCQNLDIHIHGVRRGLAIMLRPAASSTACEAQHSMCAQPPTSVQRQRQRQGQAAAWLCRHLWKPSGLKPWHQRGLLR